jgi:hypothetical protein
MPIRPLQLLAIIAFFAALSACDSTPPPPATNAYVGKTEAAVRAELGQPDHEFAGHYGNPPLHFTSQFTGEIKTLVFKRPDGEIYVSFEKRADGWMGICSQWLPQGGVF